MAEPERMMMEAQADETPSFTQAMSNIYNSYSIYLKRTLSRELNFPEDLYSDWIKYGEFGQRELLYTLGLAVAITLLRHMLAVSLFSPIARYFQLLPVNQRKFPESAWKCLFYTFIWGLNYYLLIYSGRYDFFWHPNEMFRDWVPKVAVPADLYFVYMVQSGFYLHSIYATIYMDHWRRDSNVMMFHHFLTLSLLVFSYAARYHTIGTLLLFLHDLSDVSLELTKCNVYFKNRGGKYYKFHDHAATVGFLLFAIIWFVGRLYYFPVKVLNASSHGTMIYAAERGFVDFPFFTFFNGMLLTLQMLNIYWFMFILNFLYKVATGQLREVDDVREEEVQDKIRLNNLAKMQGNHSPAQNGDRQTNGLKKRLKATE